MLVMPLAVLKIFSTGLTNNILVPVGRDGGEIAAKKISLTDLIYTGTFGTFLQIFHLTRSFQALTEIRFILY